MTTEKNSNLISLLSENEDTIAKLYRKYSETFSNKDFWSIIAKEEILHSKWIKALASDNRNFISEKNIGFDIKDIVKSIETIEKQIKSASSITLNEALSIAIKLEKSVIEQKFLEIFDTTNQDIIEVFKRLKEDTEEHSERFKIELERSK